MTVKQTKIACYIGYITQAVVNNLPPLLFVTFQRSFGISLEKIGLLIFLNFAIQILVDLLSTWYVDRLGYRRCCLVAHWMTILGLILLGILPGLMPGAPFAALLIASFFNAVGGGLIEVIVSPVMEAIPGEAKASDMSLLHSFYCWGSVGVVLCSTLYFSIVGTAHWMFLPILWALIPLCNLFLFAKVPLGILVEEEQRVPVKKLMVSRVFWLCMLMMLCSGASEMAISQWSSLFAESGLGVSKTLGDLLGPCAFAVFMGITRVCFGFFGKKMHLRKALLLSSVLCVCGYLLTVLAPHPYLSLAGCMVCGLSVGLMWPGVYSLSARYYAAGGTAMFALLALAGDVGCSVGPATVGMISDLVQSEKMAPLTSLISFATATEAGLKSGLLLAVLFPLLMFVCLLFLRRERKK